MHKFTFKGFIKIVIAEIYLILVVKVQRKTLCITGIKFLKWYKNCININIDINTIPMGKDDRMIDLYFTKLNEYKTKYGDKTILCGNAEHFGKAMDLNMKTENIFTQTMQILYTQLELLKQKKCKNYQWNRI